MSLKSSIADAIDFAPLAHRPPLSPRLKLYCAAAYLIPVMVQVGLPEGPGLADELVWLLTLAPAFLLSLHYGLKGAFAGLVMGTALFLGVQFVVAVYSTPVDGQITVPIYIAFGTLAISVGWLSEELHNYYTRALRNERMAAIGQFAVAIRHEINNALTAIVTESQLLSTEGSSLTEDQKESAQSIYDAATRIATNIQKVTNLADAPVMTYTGEIMMVDLASAKSTEAVDTIG